MHYKGDLRADWFITKGILGQTGALPKVFLGSRELQKRF